MDAVVREMKEETGLERVIGIEFRDNDGTVDLPEELPFVILPACDMIIQDIAYSRQLNSKLLDENLYLWFMKR